MREQRTSYSSPANTADSGDKPLAAYLRRPAVAVGGFVAAGGAGAALTLAGARSPVTGPLTLLFLLIAPAAGTALLLRAMDPPARAMVAGAAALVVDTAVAETMLVTSHWSPRGGVAAVGIVSAALAALAAPAAARRAPADGPAASASGAADSEDDESWVFTD